MTTGEFDLARCLEDVRQQSQDASRELVEQLYPLVIKIIRCHLPKRTDEEDLAQEVFIKLFGRLGQYTPRSGVPFEHWVSRLTVRTCLDALRSERRRPELRWSDLSEEENAWLDFMTTQNPGAPEAADNSARELVEKLLAQLPPEDRLVINLLDLEQRSVREISQITGWSNPLVKVRAFRARRKLRHLAERLGERKSYE